MASKLGLHKISYPDRLLAGFLIGVLIGTILTNLLSKEIQDQAGYFGTFFQYGFQPGRESGKELLLLVCRQRLLETGFAWLVGMTVFAVPCFCFMAAYCGFSVGMILAVTTCQKGLLGLPCYLLTLFPHYLIYIPIWLILAGWAGERTSKIRLLPLLGLCVVTLLGACLETFINPHILQLLG